MMTGAHSAAKPADDDIRALFETDAGKAAVAAVLGAPVESLVVTSYTTQVVRAGRRTRSHTTNERDAAAAAPALRLTVRALFPSPRPPQVAGVNYSVSALVNGAAHTIAAFKPLPHTGLPLEVKSVTPA